MRNLKRISDKDGFTLTKKSKNGLDSDEVFPFVV